MNIFSGLRLGKCRFCTFLKAPSELEKCRTLSEVRQAISKFASPLKTDEAASLAKHCMYLKKRNDPKSRGLIPNEVLRIVSESIGNDSSQVSCEAVRDIVCAVGDNNRSVDEYIMYKLARITSTRMPEFQVSEVLDIARIFSKRELKDEFMFNGMIEYMMHRIDTVSFSELVDFNRSLSRIGLMNAQICDAIASGIIHQRNISVREVVSCLIAFADLDYQHESITFMWDFILSKENITRYVSNDDQYGLLFAAITSPWIPSSRLVNEIVRNASSKNRIQKRIDLLRRCIVLALSPLSESLLTSSWRAPTITVRCPDEEAGVSSGLHLEVSNTLKDMRVRYTNEFNLGPFIVDILVRK